MTEATSSDAPLIDSHAHVYTTDEHAISSFRQWVPDANMRRIISGETAFRLYFV